MKEKGKRKRNRIILQIKGDNTQNLKAKEFSVKQLEKVYYEARDQVYKIPEIYQKSKESMEKKYNETTTRIKFDQDRANFHIHAIIANRNDQVLFRNHLINIQNELLKKNEEYKEEIQKLRIQQQEIENKLKSQIEEVDHQLRSLRPFQERRKIMVEQKKALEELIFKEKQIHQDQITEIHHKLLDQREYYENSLRARLEITKSFAIKFADLHIDLLTKKIAESTSSNRKDLNSLEAKLLNELLIIDNLVKTENHLAKQNQILHKNIEDATIQVIKLKQEKKNTEIQMFQTISNHEKEINNIRDILKEKEADIVNFKMEKLLKKNKRLKNEASEAFELMKKAEDNRTTNKSDLLLFNTKDKSLENDLLHKMKNAADYVIKALEDKFDAQKDQVFLEQKTSMGKLLRILTLIESKIKKLPNRTMTAFYDTETIKTNNYSNSELQEINDLEINADDLDNINNETYILNDTNRKEFFESDSSAKNNFNFNPKENIEENININDKNYKGTNNINENDDKNVTNKHNILVSVEVQTKKPIRSDLLKDIRAPPTPPNYPFQFRSELSKTQSMSIHENKFKNTDQRKRNYLYYTYTNTHASSERKSISKKNGSIIDDSTFSHLNQPASTNGETFAPKPPNMPISNQSKTRMRLRNESQNFSKAGINHTDKNEFSQFAQPTTPRRKRVQNQDCTITPEVRKKSNSGRIPSSFICVFRSPK